MCLNRVGKYVAGLRSICTIELGIARVKLEVAVAQPPNGSRPLTGIPPGIVVATALEAAVTGGDDLAEGAGAEADGFDFDIPGMEWCSSLVQITPAATTRSTATIRKIP
jgi:hypothetical protein